MVLLCVKSKDKSLISNCPGLPVWSLHSAWWPHAARNEREVETNQLGNGYPRRQGDCREREQLNWLDHCFQTQNELFKTVLTPRVGGWDQKFPSLFATMVNKILGWGVTENCNAATSLNCRATTGTKTIWLLYPLARNRLAARCCNTVISCGLKHT